jgi:bacillithiol system protein YtxJ
MAVKLDSEAVLDRLMAEETALLYKHSTRCPTCSQTKRHIIRLMKSQPELPVYIVDVLADRSISQQAARRLGVRHESPQAIVLRNGKAIWHASHYGVRRSAIEQALGEE